LYYAIKAIVVRRKGEGNIRNKPTFHFSLVVSASSDRTIKLWKPSIDSFHTIGYHTDYAKCLAYASKPGWVASGGLDRRIILWDIEKSEATLTMDSGPTHHVTDGPTESTSKKWISWFFIYLLTLYI
jgi:WD40 repeat protein